MIPSASFETYQTSAATSGKCSDRFVRVRALSEQSLTTLTDCDQSSRVRLGTGIVLERRHARPRMLYRSSARFPRARYRQSGDSAEPRLTPAYLLA